MKNLLLISLISITIFGCSTNDDSNENQKPEIFLTVQVVEPNTSGGTNLPVEGVTVKAYNNGSEFGSDATPLATGTTGSDGKVKISVKDLLGFNTSKNIFIVAEKDIKTNYSSFSRGENTVLVDNQSEGSKIILIQPNAVAFLIKNPIWNIHSSSLGSIDGCSMDNYLTFTKKNQNNYSLEMRMNEGANVCDGAMETYAYYDFTSFSTETNRSVLYFTPSGEQSYNVAITGTSDNAFYSTGGFTQISRVRFEDDTLTTTSNLSGTVVRNKYVRKN